MIHQYKDRPLNIYRASAGSGKTHLLTGFYIKLLFVKELLPETHSGEMKFNEILAVTFTNKATAEMKGRIIDELYLLSTEPQKSDYWKDIVPENTPKEDAAAQERIKKKATSLLVQILNEYSSFNISTIDSFFQKIVRSFARELNIPGNYEVELDSDRVLDAAISNFLDKLDEKDTPELFDWMVKFACELLSESNKWDVRRDLFEMAKKVLNTETYRLHRHAINEFTSDKQALGAYEKMLNEIIDNWRTTLKQLGEEGIQLFASADLRPEDLFYKGVGNYSCFAKWAQGSEEQPGSRFFEGIENPNKKLYPKKVPSQSICDALQALMQRCIDHTMGDPYRDYFTAKAIRSNFYELGILANIDKEVTDYCNEHNVMLLSSTTELLSRLIGEDDAPFIYEKTGSHIHAYMIDEFQDTSGMQWSNFKPLVSNALSEQYQNLIVGDVKQSIYRWRGGDWNLLNSEINSYEAQLHYDDSTSLSTNWRSLPPIVEFNNDFFPKFAAQLDNMLGQSNTRIQQIYQDVRQSLPNKTKKVGEPAPVGLVHIEFLQPKDENGQPKEKAKKEDFMNEAARQLPEVIIKLQQNGFSAREIAILCRTNNECRWAAESILQYKQDHPDCPYVLDIISNEALQISVRPAIHVLINLMRHLAAPQSPILAAIAQTSLMQLSGLSPDESLNRYFALSEADRVFHPELAHQPLYELTEQLIALLPAESQRNDAPYLQAFRDLALEFVSKQSADLTEFIEWWDLTGCKKSITTPEAQNAIQILSVHKSKGLGMPAIIIPFASWNLDLDSKHSELIWCEPKKNPFTLDVLLPVKLGKHLENTIFAQEYADERERAVIDNLNTAYVAFTRAKEAMVILAPDSAKEGRMLEHWLKAYCKEKNAEQALTFGQWQRIIPKKDEKNESTIKNPEIVEQTGEEEPATFPTEAQVMAPASDAQMPESQLVRLPQISILHSPDKPDVTAKQRGTYIHYALQGIKTPAEASRVIHHLYLRGDIDPAVIDEDEMQQTIARLLSLPEVKPWFDPKLTTVLNELTLIDNKGQQHRPDRIVIDADKNVTVIDYKTGSSHRGYEDQVRGYAQLLRDIGYQNVRSYLLFIKDEKVHEVR